MTDSQRTTRSPRWTLADLIARANAWRTDAGDHARTQRMAGTVFFIRVASAAIIYASHVLLARWMGRYEFGVFVYAWTCLLLAGDLVDLGLGTAAQRFIPQYVGTRSDALLRGFLSGSRWFAVAIATFIASLGALGIWFFDTWISDYDMLPLYLACAALPLYALTSVQEGIARSYNWVLTAMLPGYLARPVILLLVLFAIYAVSREASATTAMMGGVFAIWVTAIAQFTLIDRRLGKVVHPGPKQHDLKGWLSTSFPIFLVSGFYVLLTSTDVLALRFFRSPDDIAVYYAASKTLSLVAFVYFSVAAATAHRFAAYHVAGNHEQLATFLAKSIQWTFWPSLGATALILAFGWPILRLFGEHFVEGYSLMFVLAAGLIARAALGPVENLLTMLGEQRVCALIYAGMFAFNILACVVLIPIFGTLGAAASTSTALIVQSVLLFAVTKRRLGLHAFIWRPPGAR